MQDLVPKVLFGSPIRQRPEILREFLSGVEQLEGIGLLRVDYFFIDDNIESESTRLLHLFADKHPNITICPAPTSDQEPYLCNETTHVWEENIIWKVADFKNLIIERARNAGYDYLFLVDSDLVLHPKTLVHLVDLEKDIISEIFWTRWEPDYPELPQVWLSDQYNLYKSARGKDISQEEIVRQFQAFVRQLRVPGVYPVGGLGACTLLSKKALEAGVNYKEIYNISFSGEDRHFCIRAAALGFQLYVDTHYPAYHIYRLADLAGLDTFERNASL